MSSTLERQVSPSVASTSNASALGAATKPRPSLLERAWARRSRSDSASSLNQHSQNGGPPEVEGLNGVSSAVLESKEGAGGIREAQKTLRSFSGIFQAPEVGSRPVPPPALTEDQQAKYAEVLDYFKALPEYPISLKAAAAIAAGQKGDTRAADDWEKLRMLSRESMLRYLRATRWDVANAKKRLTESIAWRREFGVDTIDAAEVEAEAKCGKETVLGFDNKARPLHYMHPHRNDTKESPRQMKFAVWILERCIDMMPPGVEQLALLINFDSRSRNPTSISNAKLMLYILQNHYVERLGVALCINVPWIFKAFWSAIQAFIDPVTKSKCKFDEAIKSEVPGNQLSDDFGGDLDGKYEHDLYWPALVRACDRRRAAMMARFKEKCNGEIGASEWIIRGGEDDEGKKQFELGELEAGKMTPAMEALSKQLSGSASSPGAHPERVKAIAAAEARSKGSQVPVALATPLETTQEETAKVTKETEKTPPRQTSEEEDREEVMLSEIEDKGVKHQGESSEDMKAPTLGLLHITKPSPPADSSAPASSSVTPAANPDSFFTPRETISQNPLDRAFSKVSVTATTTAEGAIGAAPVAATAVSVEPAEAVAPTLTMTSVHGEPAVSSTDSDVIPATTAIPKDRHPSPARVGFVKALHAVGIHAHHHDKERSDPKGDGAANGNGHVEHATADVSEGGRASTEVEQSDKKASTTSSSSGKSSIARKHPALAAAFGMGVAGSLHRKNKASNDSVISDGEVTAVGTTGSVATDGLHSRDGTAGAGVEQSAVEGSHKDVADEGIEKTSAPASIKVLYFAAARTAAGVSSEQVILPKTPLSLAELGTFLVDPSSKSDRNAEELAGVLKRARWSVGENMVEEEDVEKVLLNGGEEVAVIPPVSGG